MMKILGIDPGLNKTGWGLISSERSNHGYLDHGVIKTSAGGLLPLRLHFIFSELKSIILQNKPDHIAIEETYVNINAKSSLVLAEARAAAIIAAVECGVIIHMYQAKTMKKTITGDGNAAKDQVSKMLLLRLDNLKNITSRDATDALGLALCHAYYA